MPAKPPFRSAALLSFLPGNGVGGAGVSLERPDLALPSEPFALRSHLEERYGKDALPAGDMTIQDWPLSYDDIEPYYDRFEKLCGTSGKAGNIRGQNGGAAIRSKAGARRNIHTPLKQGYGATLFAEAARKAGHSPFPQPAVEPERSLCQPARHQARPVHLLRFLRALRLRQLFEVEPADLRAAGAATVFKLLLRRPNRK